jgi:hypothetical protein
VKLTYIFIDVLQAYCYIFRIVRTKFSLLYLKISNGYSDAVIKRWTYNTMDTRKRTNRQTIIHKALHSQLVIDPDVKHWRVHDTCLETINPVVAGMVKQADMVSQN